jgi:hypothetical protein
MFIFFVSSVSRFLPKERTLDQVCLTVLVVMFEAIGGRFKRWKVVSNNPYPLWQGKKG